MTGMTALKKEVDAVAALLQEGADTPADLAKLVIKRLDEVRAERVTHFLVMKFGSKQSCFYTGFGPFSTANQAVKTFEKHPAAGMATGYAVVPTVNHLGFEELLARVDAPAESRGNWPEVEKDRAAFKNGWKGRGSDRERYLS